MKRILEFKAFESLNGLTEVQKAWLDKCTRGSWSVGPDGKVDVEGDFNCSKQDLVGFKGVRFGRVSGGFSCSNNRLETLEGAPETVGGDFYCGNNRLETLEGAPETVDGGFYCSNNRLETLEGAPDSVGGDFLCYNNRLTTLEGSPESVGGSFYSGSIEIPKGQWDLSSWLKVLEEGTPEAQKLIATLISPEALNKRLEESPERTMVALKSVWNSSEFAKTRSQLKIPKGYEDEMDLLGDLDDIGL
jgi:hypothetical protein